MTDKKRNLSNSFTLACFDIKQPPFCLGNISNNLTPQVSNGLKLQPQIKHLGKHLATYNSPECQKCSNDCTMLNKASPQRNSTQALVYHSYTKNRLTILQSTTFIIWQNSLTMS